MANPWDNIDLNDSEKEEALNHWRKVKWFHERNLSYWLASEQDAVELEAKVKEEKRERDRLKRNYLKS